MRARCIHGVAFVLALFTTACGERGRNHAEIDAVLRRAVEDGDVVGVVAMAATSDRVLYRGSFGKRDRTTGADMTLDSLFWIASMTKPVTSVAAMQLVEEGALDLDDPVSTYIPEFDPKVLQGFDESSGAPMFRQPTSPVTVRHLLTHTAGFGYELWNPLLRDAVARGIVPSIMTGSDEFLGAPLVFDPGTRWHYGIHTDWLGRLVERVRGATLEKVFREHIFEPLGMKDTHFDVPPEEQPRLVAVYRRQPDGPLVDEESSPPPPARTFFSGGGGLVSTAADYTRFLQMFLEGGSLKGARVLAPETVALMAENHIGELEAGAMTTVMPEVTNDFDFFPGSSDRFGLGFLLNADPVPGGRAEGSLSWAGVYNTYFWIDRNRGVAGVVLVQILPFFDGPTVSLLEEFEKSVYASVDEPN